ncbi:MAG TPA: hypothetical protein VLM43_11375 [Desulfobacterales bacterium]|nr:hypothetical protein [Desulfobacterales bacterium]
MNTIQKTLIISTILLTVYVAMGLLAYGLWIEDRTIENQVPEMICNTTNLSNSSEELKKIVEKQEPIELIELKLFLKNDSTDQVRWTQYFQCGDFSRALIKNASIAGIQIGNIILGHDKHLSGKRNHTMNYIIVNGTIYLIEPQNDQILKIDQTEYEYYKLYPDGQAPARWGGNLNATEIIYDC